MKDELLSVPPYGLTNTQKIELLLPELIELTDHHVAHCEEYRRVFSHVDTSQINKLADIPFLTVPLFKQRQLKSIADAEIFKVLQSSGTTGQLPSRIYLDANAAKLQSKVLVKIMQEWLGKGRRHMLIWDHPNVIKDRSSYSARGAGIQGLSFLGRDHTFVLNEDMSLNLEAFTHFIKHYSDKPVLMFGFTFMLWQYGLKALQALGIKVQLQDAVLLHSGGWKKLVNQAVSSEHFNATAQAQFGKVRVHNFYGMVEQVGSIFVACEKGHFHCPNTADILIRRPGTWQLAAIGEAGVIQVVSALARSYPGHSLLTEDKGILLGEDDCPCGRKGRYFRVLGRIAKVETRGCSDTFEKTGRGL